MHESVGFFLRAYFGGSFFGSFWRSFLGIIFGGNFGGHFWGHFKGLCVLYMDSIFLDFFWNKLVMSPINTLVSLAWLMLRA